MADIRHLYWGKWRTSLIYLKSVLNYNHFIIDSVMNRYDYFFEMNVRGVYE